jgi:esterase/lipase superfamily enzyme
MEDFFKSKHLVTVSHSMGNRLVNWYLQSRYDKSNGAPEHFSEVVLTSPDIDRATFKNYFYKVSANGDKTRIFVSSKDIPLRLSKFVHGSPRTGLDVTRNENKWEMPGNIKDTQTVNFTDVESGLLGHSIQYKVIGNMHRDGKPGEGLELEPDKTFKGDYVRVERVDK